MRIAITGAPRTGKSTVALKWALRGVCLEHRGYCATCEVSLLDAERVTKNRTFRIPLLCTDPIHLVKDVEAGVTYVPRDVYYLAKAAGQSGDDPGPDKPWSSSSWYVAEHFLTRPGPWILEGVGVSRALRKWRKIAPHADGLDRQSLEAFGPQPPPIDKLIVMRVPRAPQLPGQVSQGKGCLTVLRDLLPWLGTRVEWR